MTVGLQQRGQRPDGGGPASEDFLALTLSARDSEGSAALDLTLDAAGDRVALVCAADPRPVLELLRDRDGLASPRARALLAFVFSDEHLRLRAAWGYIPEEGGDAA